MAVTRSFGTPVTDMDMLMGAVAQYAMRAGEKLRQHGLVAGRLTVFFHTNWHKQDRPQYSATRTLTIQPMTNDGLMLLAYARRGIESAWREGYGITKAGVMLEDLIDADRRPRTLFEEDSGRRDRLMVAMDQVNMRFGTFAAVPASQGFKREWAARSDSKSPNYTTRIAEVPAVKAR
jgi:DNA polymerase V